MKGVVAGFETVVVSTRIRLARNLADYPFPSRILRDKHAEEQAGEIVDIVAEELGILDNYVRYDMADLTDDQIAYFLERNLISRDLIKHKRISAALIHSDETVSVMVNEEDHIRIQYFMKGYWLYRAYERTSGIDDILSESLPYAYDGMLGYLTACPTNLGTGMRASVMMFLPALVKARLIGDIKKTLREDGLTMRGSSGEGSVAEGFLFQISNERTIGLSEREILEKVDAAVSTIVEWETRERKALREGDDGTLEDRAKRAYGLLTNCYLLDEKEFVSLMTELKFGFALGFIGRNVEAVDPKNIDKIAPDKRMYELDKLMVEMRPANVRRVAVDALTEREQNIYRAKHTGERLVELFGDKE